MLSKKDNTGSIQRSRLPKNCKRLWTRVMRLWTWAMAVGFQPIREFPGISRCWDVEDQRSLVLCAGGSIWHFWRRQMQLLQQKLRLNGVEISDLWVLCFGSLYWFLVQSFTPSLIHKSFFTSQRYILHTKDDIKTNNHRRKQWTVTEFECFFHNLPNKKPKSWSKSHGSPIFGPFFGYHFFNGFFLSAWEPPGKRRSWENPGSPEATPISTWRPGTATSRRCATSSVWLRSACTRKIGMVGGLKEWLNCDSGGVVGGRCQKKSNILKFGVDRNLDFSMLVYVWIWTSRLLMITNGFAICPCDQREMNTWSWGDDEE